MTNLSIQPEDGKIPSIQISHFKARLKPAAEVVEISWISEPLHDSRLCFEYK